MDGVAAVRRRHVEMSLQTHRAIHAMKMRQIVEWLRRKQKIERPSASVASVPDAEMAERPLPPIDRALAAGIDASASSFAAMQTDINAPPESTIPLRIDAPLEDHLEFVSRSVWGVTLRAMQRSALTRLFRPSKKLLVVQQTGTGKSHIYRMVGTMLNGIHLVIHPLLVLTADQIVKFKEGDNCYGAIEVHNLDEQAT